MSASAGKVMPRPMGDYNALTEYKVLDIVTYNDRPYMAKQTTQGNLPTNTTYWMLLLDFPTEVDNAPTQNSNNLVKSGGVYSALTDKLDADFGNASNIKVGTDSAATLSAASITKDAGSSKIVIITIAENNNRSINNIVATLQSHTSDNTVYFENTDPTYIIIDSVDVVGTTITANAHLKEDDSAAISLTNRTLYFQNYIKNGETSNEITGYGNSVNGSRSTLQGCGLSVYGDNSTAEGVECSVGADMGHAEGRWTYAGQEAHSEGRSTEASGNYSHAEGVKTIASNAGSHAEGSTTTASGEAAHAEGYNTTASGFATHASGSGTVAGYSTQTVCGTYNNNKSDTLLEIGNGGGSGSRANVFEVYSTGHISQNDGTDKYKFAKSGGVNGYYDSSNDFHPFTGYREFVNNSVVLSTFADTTVTFSDASITADSTIEPFTSVYSIAPKDCVASAGQCVVTIPKQSTAQTIKVKIRVS